MVMDLGPCSGGSLVIGSPCGRSPTPLPVSCPGGEEDCGCEPPCVPVPCPGEEVSWSGSGLAWLGRGLVVQCPSWQAVMCSIGSRGSSGGGGGHLRESRGLGGPGGLGEQSGGVDGTGGRVVGGISSNPPDPLCPASVVLLVDFVTNLDCDPRDPAAPPLPLGVHYYVAVTGLNLYRLGHHSLEWFLETSENLHLERRGGW